MKKYLMVEVKEITDDLKDGLWIIALGGREEIGRIRPFATQVRWNKDFKLWESTGCRLFPDWNPTHYLPKGMPTHTDTVDVFESEATEPYTEEFGEGQFGPWNIKLPEELLPGVKEGQKIMVVKP